MENLVQKVRNIPDDKIENAINLLQQQQHANKNVLATIQKNWNSLDNDNRQGLLSRDNFNVSRNRLWASIYQEAERIDEEDAKHLSKETIMGKDKSIIVALIGFIGVVIAAFITASDGSLCSIFNQCPDPTAEVTSITRTDTPELNSGNTLEPTPTSIESTFQQSSLEGWGIYPAESALELLTENENGYLEWVDNGDGKISHFIAPEEFHGDWASYNMLSFNIKSYGGSYFHIEPQRADVRIFSGDQFITRYLPTQLQRDASIWNTIAINLADDSRWYISPNASFASVLSNVTRLEIRAEFGYGPDTANLDNVRLSGTTQPLVSPISNPFLPDVNLLNNPGAESKLQFWRSNVDSYTVRCAQNSDGDDCVDEPAARSGTYYFFPGPCEECRVDGVDATLTQSIALQDFHTAIDNLEFEANIGGYVRNYEGADPSRIIVKFLDAGSKELAISDSGERTADFWTLWTDTIDIPVGTRSIEFQLVSRFSGGATNTDGYYDDLFVYIRQK
ncbi:MAG: laminin B domain-containing protein [Candidatus Promineifilaceae bacterium]